MNRDEKHTLSNKTATRRPLLNCLSLHRLRPRRRAAAPGSSRYPRFCGLGIASQPLNGNEETMEEPCFCRKPMITQPGFLRYIAVCHPNY
ncbi:hypothetical protein AKJ16_DCAP20367 [Drosera capensis]